MRQRKILALLLALVLLLTACAPAAGDGELTPTAPEATDPPELTDSPEPPEETEPAEDPAPPQTPGDIWLYGESHGYKNVLEEELRLWRDAYDRGLRHMFVEYPCYTAEFLNLWMAAEDDTILEEVYADWTGTLAHNENVKAFYQSIKADCPETVFHGTDVGHQYQTIGARYLQYLRENGQEDTEQYRLAQECVEQGELYYRTRKDAYRERMMAENFIRELESLEGEEIMGFYGTFHTGMEPFDCGYGAVSVTMARQLQNQYGEKLHIRDLSYLAQDDLEPEGVDTIQVGERSYEASYFGKADLSAWSDTYLCREFWRLEGAYDDFRDAPVTGNVLPCGNYPTRLEEGQVFVIDYTRRDGTVERQFLRCDGGTWQGMLTTVEFLPSE